MYTKKKKRKPEFVKTRTDLGNFFLEQILKYLLKKKFASSWSKRLINIGTLRHNNKAARKRTSDLVFNPENHNRI